MSSKWSFKSINQTLFISGGNFKFQLNGFRNVSLPFSGWTYSSCNWCVICHWTALKCNVVKYHTLSRWMVTGLCPPHVPNGQAPCTQLGNISHTFHTRGECPSEWCLNCDPLMQPVDIPLWSEQCVICHWIALKHNPVTYNTLFRPEGNVQLNGVQIVSPS
jgi:hypothetical protein